MGEVTLKPCPFCGSGDVELRESITDALVACNVCGGRTGFVFLGSDDAANAYKLREVAEAWNTRMTAARPVDDDVERLRGIVEAFIDIEQGTDETGFTPTVEQMLMDLATEARAALSGGGK